MAISNNFIKLDRRLIRYLGLNTSVVFSHILGIEKAINSKQNTNNAIYQQLDRLIYDTGISKATLIKCIKELEDMQLLHTIKNTERNKTKYKIDNKNYNELLKIIDTIDNKNVKKNSQNAKEVKKVVSNLYNQYLKNDTTNSTNFDTTDKDLKEIKNKNKKERSSKTFLRNAVDINYYENKVFIGNKTYHFIPYLFKDTDEEQSNIIKVLCKSKNVGMQEIDTLEYFLQNYYKRYGEYHKPTTDTKVIEILQTINNIYSNYHYIEQVEDMKYIIDEYFNTKNKDLTIWLFISKSDNGLYSWINTIAKRLGY